MLDTIYLGVKGLRNNPFHQKIVEIYSATQRQGDQYVHVKQSYRTSLRPNADQSWQKSIRVLLTVDASAYYFKYEQPSWLFSLL